ncbi:hypothetical protein ES288_A03G243000v1 [Gossypium darwinii]|uniref:Uncharacterized protein n=2 Tax=Gossypium TaxID=3633 RepID=A0A5D2RC47_GOSTO|nr:hypothetical protein ES288_A03G243000v1 [Gossypium darwinii]TYI37778.1 hypothetical protein ES332_A03G237600v1 [Gossypium tomentosum]
MIFLSTPCIYIYRVDYVHWQFLSSHPQLLKYFTFAFLFQSIHLSKTTMAIRLPRIVSSKKVPKGYFVVYVGENQKRFVIPVSFLNQQLFQDLLGKSEEEFGYSHPTGGLTIPCNENTFLEVTSRLY